MPLSEGWRDQYERMLRSHARLAETAAPSPLDAAEARDRLYHFFQDAYHLKDWLKNDQAAGLDAVTNQALERHITATPALAMCADLCNGTKHLTLRDGRIPGSPAVFTSQDIDVAFTPDTCPADPAVPLRLRMIPRSSILVGHTWVASSNDQRYDVFVLANGVVAAWNDWLDRQGITP
ncbi:hypothetical protein [Nonomuraea zeae]|uniref:Uncharacterized protein n=1 Tax=Nonomuraea zeae TaxID=1642303 RepID=A0A5S4HJP1_9ACTN|nr:hypothetical protein [Nonomuraea zeae]TMR39570.1 hypothetical protein ETD85_00730 [Nonomuraea zeae]